jgi:hypothetical protein
MIIDFSFTLYAAYLGVTSVFNSDLDAFMVGG